MKLEGRREESLGKEREGSGNVTREGQGLVP